MNSSATTTSSPPLATLIAARWKLLKYVDHKLLLLIVMLTLLGVGFLCVSSFNISMKYTGEPFYFVKRQLGWLVLSLFTLSVFTLIPLRVFTRYSSAILLIMVLLLVFTLIPALSKSVSHTRRWTDLGILPFALQPSELIKPFFLILITQLVTTTKQQASFQKDRQILTLVIILLVSFLIAIQPDLSTAIIFLTTGGMILLVSNFNTKYLISAAVLSLPIWIWVLQSKQYIVNRLLFLNPEQDPYGSGYHIIRSLHAHSSGGWLGLPNEKILPTLAKLPDAHNDFSFAALAAGHGFIGIFFLLACFIFFLERGSKITKAQSDPQATLLGIAITFIITLEALLHIAVTLGMFPTTGTPLPFISYGGSSLLAHYALIGCLLNISMSPPTPPTPPPVTTPS